MFFSSALFSRRLLKWYDRNRRDLPWRVPPGQRPNPYHILLSETMLQQTQVATVLPYFHRFIAKFPTLADLAAADEQSVLRLWQGLGYYSRARNLHAAAKLIIHEKSGEIPRDVESLWQLPGVGRYTAGAIASIAFDVPAPILDGNVIRILCRLDRIAADPRDRQIQQQLWRHAARIVPKNRPGDFNSALMELGATLCTPRSPQCLICPVKKHCQAFAAGLQDQIPLPRKKSAPPLLHRRTFCLRNDKLKWLIEQRPPRGRWAGLWQFVTSEADESPVSAATVHLAAGVKSSTPRQISTIRHALTHRRYRFDVYLCDVRHPCKQNRGAARRWVALDELEQYPLPRPHVRIAEFLKTLPA
ncbi:MAG TPA: A/G-specific adenine glycosylase [Tepidisphaeraceae bacterium]